jgi:D-alanine-D-alanine ligase
LEINPLPGLDYIYSDLPIMGRLAGISYTEMVNAIVDAAWQRYSSSEKFLFN